MSKCGKLSTNRMNITHFCVKAISSFPTTRDNNFNLRNFCFVITFQML